MAILTRFLRRKQLHPFKETARKDPYRSQAKPEGTPRCPHCGSVSMEGRWYSADDQRVLKADLPVQEQLTCPACRQQEDRFAQGVVELHGESWKKSKDFVMRTVRRTEEIERSRNDQERILWIKEMTGVTKIYVSLPELARHIGRELGKSFKGKVEYERTRQEPYLRVRWWAP